MIATILRDEWILGIIGILLCAIVLSSKQYFYPETINSSLTKKIKITLSKEPKYKEGGDHSHPYILIEGNSIRRKFLVDFWSLNKTRTGKLLSLNIGEKLILLISKEEMDKKLIKNLNYPVTILGIRQENTDEWIFDLEGYNEGKSKTWKKIWFYLGLFAVFIIPALIFRIRTIVNKS